MRRRKRKLAETYVLDSSIVVKWFKKGEEREAEALRLKDDILESRVSAVCSDWLLVEVVRGLMKAGFPGKRVEACYSALREIGSLGFLEQVSVGDVLDLTKDAEITLALYASDAVHLATAVSRRATLLTEDEHLLKKAVVEYASERGVSVRNLKGFYS